MGMYEHNVRTGPYKWAEPAFLKIRRRHIGPYLKLAMVGHGPHQSTSCEDSPLP